MPRTIPIASAAFKAAFLAVSFAAFSLIAAAAPAHHHAAKSSVHTAAHGGAHKPAHTAATRASAHSSARAGHPAARSTRASYSSRTPRASARTTRRASRPNLQPRSAAARRAHARIREEIAHRHHHYGPAPAPLRPEIRSARLVIPAPLRGSHESLVHQNQMAEAEGLERIIDDSDLANRIHQGSLVPVPTSYALHINTDLPENRRYCRPWTARFLTDLSRAHAEKFGDPLEVTSAVRTVEYQRQLRHINGNAAAADGDIASPHLTGGTIDIGKTGLNSREIGWIRTYLIPLEEKGLIDVEEEFKQSCFHISVYRKYSEQRQAVGASAKMTVPTDGSMVTVQGR